MVVDEMADAVTDNGVDTEVEVRKLQVAGRVDIPTEMHEAMGANEGDNVFVRWNGDRGMVEIIPANPERLD